MPASEEDPLLSPRSASRLSDRDARWFSTRNLARLVTFSSSFSEGWDLAIFMVILLPVIEEFQLSPFEIGLLSATPILGGILGFSCVGLCMDGIGRKPTIVITNIVQCIACLIMAISPSALVFGFARTLLAFSLKSGLVAVCVYMAELSAAKDRGKLVSFEEVFINVGLCACAGTGWLLFHNSLISWRSFSAIGAIAPASAVVLILILRIPESPRYMQMKGDEAKALATLCSLLDGDEAEARKTLDLWYAERTPRDASSGTDARTCQALRGACTAVAHHAWLISMLVWVARAGCGITFMTTYFTLILRPGMTHKEILSWMAVAYGLKLLALIPSSVWLIESIGRRPLLITSTVGCLITLSVISVLFSISADMVLVACFIILFFMSFSLGLGPVPFVYTAEILPNKQRGSAAAWSWIPGEIVVYLLLVAGPELLRLHPSFPFALLAGINFCNVIFFWVCCPETKGILLEEAKNLFVSEKGR